MASTRLLLEGSDIESLLAQVREQYGEAARIISADKVRSGGIGGFFAKERYELSVEIDDAPAPGAEWPALPTPAHERAAAAIDSVQALLDLADRQENALSGDRPAASGGAPAGAAPGSSVPGSAGPGSAAPGSAGPVTSPYDAIRTIEAAQATRATPPTPPAAPFTPQALPSAHADGPPALPPAAMPPAAMPPAAMPPAAMPPAAMPPSVVAAPPAAVPADPPLPSTSGAEFAEILSGLRHNIGVPPPVPQPAVRPFRPAPETGAGHPAVRNAYADISSPADDPFPGAASILGDTLSAEAFAPTEPLAAQPFTAAEPFAAAARAFTTPGSGTETVTEPPTAHGRHAAAQEAPAPTWTPPAPPPAIAPVAPAATGLAAGLAAGLSAGHAAAPADDRYTDAPTTGPTTGLARQLIDLGLPANLAHRAVGRDPYSGVVRALGMLPASPPAPSAPGEILVVAGELSGAMAVARQAAKRMRIDPAAILVVGPTVGGTGLHSSRRLTGAADAQKRAARLHAADVPHVVVVDAPLDSENSRWVRTIVEALRATAVWAVVDATRKTADVARQLRGFGLVDAIAVHGVTATGDPASVLSLGVPVASLDGRRATPQAWAALLCDRLDHADD